MECEYLVSLSLPLCYFVESNKLASLPLCLNHHFNSNSHGYVEWTGKVGENERLSNALDWTIPSSDFGRRCGQWRDCEPSACHCRDGQSPQLDSFGSTRFGKDHVGARLGSATVGHALQGCRLGTQCVRFTWNRCEWKLYGNYSDWNRDEETNG